MNEKTKTYWTDKEAAEQLSIGRTKVRQLAKEAGAEKKIGKSYRINVTKLLDYVDNL
jgi:excisionase family DNA binding protein